MKRFKLILIACIIVVIAGMILYFASLFSANQRQEAAVIEQIRTLNRWETSSYTIQQIIDSGNSGNVFQRLLFGDRILLVAQGTVVSGFDLSNISSKSIHINGKSVSVDLPAPEILSTSLDESQTKVYDRQKGLLVPSNDNLESEARASAVNKIRQAACTGGILTVASDNAKKQLTSMMQALGFSEITISVPQGHC
ncbi:MAG TPA: DUF4230 domain-containing protein [Candidatus Saccharimonadales bacterium]|nr:DUF4230 domain-containing protein [Candidatus Saccharimonadales bacterium]